MEQRSTPYLRRRRRALLRRLPPLTAVLRGSLIERYKRCGNPDCKCASGRGHGPKYYLSISHPNSTPSMDYVPLECQPQVAEYLANYRLIREILEELCQITRELLRRREPL